MPAPTGDDSTKCQSLDDPRSKYLCNDYCKNNGIGDSHVVQCGKHKGICKCDGYKPIQPEPGKIQCHSLRPSSLHTANLRYNPFIHYRMAKR